MVCQRWAEWELVGAGASSGDRSRLYLLRLTLALAPNPSVALQYLYFSMCLPVYLVSVTHDKAEVVFHDSLGQSRGTVLSAVMFGDHLGVPPISFLFHLVVLFSGKVFLCFLPVITDQILPPCRRRPLAVHAVICYLQSQTWWYFRSMYTQRNQASNLLTTWDFLHYLFLKFRVSPRASFRGRIFPSRWQVIPAVVFFFFFLSAKGMIRS